MACKCLALAPRCYAAGICTSHAADPFMQDIFFAFLFFIIAQQQMIHATKNSSRSNNLLQQLQRFVKDKFHRLLMCRMTTTCKTGFISVCSLLSKCWPFLLLLSWPSTNVTRRHKYSQRLSRLLSLQGELVVSFYAFLRENGLFNSEKAPPSLQKKPSQSQKDIFLRKWMGPELAKSVNETENICVWPLSRHGWKTNQMAQLA